MYNILFRRVQGFGLSMGEAFWRGEVKGGGLV